MTGARHRQARPRRFVQADVFSRVPLRGNGLAVVVDAEGLDDDTMQTFAAWTNLAETTFLLPPDRPDADYRLRIFTPGREMPFAGHPTLGSCAAWLHCGGVPRTAGRVVQDCAIGLVEIDLTGDVPAFAAPPTAIADIPGAEIDRHLAALGLAARDVVNAVRLDNGPVWTVFELRSAAAALAIDADRVRWPDFAGLGVFARHDPGIDHEYGIFAPHPASEPFDYEVRNLAPSSGMREDPITGSLNAAIACWLRAEGRLTDPLVMRQGTRMGRAGRVHIRPDGARILIGGATHVLIEGTVTV
jgi:PhzF family phenazine biosynthesis protein